MIRETLRRQGAVTITELVQAFGVSAMTVRRDLEQLEQQGVLRRTHGGAIARVPQAPDPSFTQRDQLQQQAKDCIARYAAELVQDGDQIILDSGSTVAAMSPYLEQKQGLTVITYSIPVVRHLIHLEHIQLICTGGMGDPTTDALVGPLAERMLEGVRVDKAFLGATSISLEDGFSNSNLQNLALQRILLRVARETYVLADSTKFSRHPFWLVASLREVTAIITDEQAPTENVAQIEQAGISIKIASTHPPEEEEAQKRTLREYE
jgi:DeoR/GlpR family transcriptional regulator of sugar metabolism